MHRLGLLGLVLLLAPARARADEVELPLELEWSAPAECYSAAMIRAELARIARVRPGRTPTPLAARGRIEKQGADYHLSLTTERKGVLGERNLTASECRSLGREVTLVLALSFGEGVELLPDEAAEEPVTAEQAARNGSPAAQVKPKPRNSKEPLRAPQRSSRAGGFRAAPFVSGGALLRALPETALQASVGVELGSEQWWLAPRISAVKSVTDSLERGVDARYDALGAGLALCLGSELASLRAAGCAAFAATAVRGRSSGATESGSETAPWYSAGPALSLSWPADALVSVRLEAALWVSLNQPRYVVDGLGEAHRIPLWVPNPSLSLVLRP